MVFNTSCNCFSAGHIVWLISLEVEERKAQARRERKRELERARRAKQKEERLRLKRLEAEQKLASASPLGAMYKPPNVDSAQGKFEYTTTITPVVADLSVDVPPQPQQKALPLPPPPPPPQPQPQPTTVTTKPTLYDTDSNMQDIDPSLL